MSSMASLSKGYDKVYRKHFNSKSLTENLDDPQKPWYAPNNFAEDCAFFSSSSGSPMSVEYFADGELISEEASWDLDLQLDRFGDSCPMRRDLDEKLTYCQDAVGYLAAPTSSWSCIEEVNQRAVIPESYQGNFSSERSSDVLPDEYRRFMKPMWSPPASPTFQATPYQVEDAFPDLQIVMSNPMRMNIAPGRQDDSPQEKIFDEMSDGSFLFITTHNVAQLKVILRERSLQVQDIGKTRTPGVLVVLFKTHESAKRAFITQQEIGIRMEPPSCTKKNWFKNPSPKFHVIFETTRRLTVKAGKSSSNKKLGDFLMTDARNRRGCLVLADQLKGHRLRIVGYIGKFKRKDGFIIEQKSIFERTLVGWISTQCHKTNENFVIRKSMNKIEDYLYNDAIQAVE